MTRRKAEIRRIPEAGDSQNANRNAYGSMRVGGILQPERCVSRAAAQLQGAMESLESLLARGGDLPPALAADLNEAVGMIMETLQLVSATGGELARSTALATAARSLVAANTR